MKPKLRCDTVMLALKTLLDQLQYMFHDYFVFEFQKPSTKM